MKKIFAFIITSIIVLSTSFAISIPTYALDSDFLGMNENLHRYTDYQDVCNRIIASGIKHVRFQPSWESIETANGVYDENYLAKIDTIVNTFKNNNVELVFILGFTPQWASSQPNATSPTRYKPSNWTYWEDYVTYITNRYNNKVKYWEVWNEPDHSGFWKDSVADYYTLLDKAYDKIKLSNENNIVLLGGLALNNGSVPSYGLGTFFDTLMELGATDSFDIVNYHLYSATNYMINYHNGMLAVINKYSIGDKPIWITETGITSTDDYYKANGVDEAYPILKSLTNVEKAFRYNYRETATGGSSEDNFGLVNNNLVCQRGYYAYQSSLGAETDFNIQNNFAALAQNALTLYYVPTTSGDGSRIANSGSNKIISSTYFMYCRINDNWLYNNNGGLDTSAYIDVTYLDNGTGAWKLQYDSTSSNYTSTSSVNKNNTGLWKTQTFTLNDILFANRQNNSADFRIWAQTGDLTISKIAIRKESIYGKCILKTNNIYKYLQQYITTNTAIEPYTTVATIGGIECRAIANTNNKYFYFSVADAVCSNSYSNIKIRVKYYDSGTDKLLLHYCSTSGSYKGVTIQKTNTNTWLWNDIVITDAKLNNTENYQSDFRIGNNNDGTVEYVSEVQVIKQ